MSQKSTEIYSYRPGFGAPVPAQVAGRRLAQLTREHGGHLKAQHAVDDARPPGSDLHPCFNWDDRSAAEERRCEQARLLIRSVHVLYKEEDRDGRGQGPEARPVLNYVRVRLAETGSCYVTTARALTDEELREQVLAEALGAFEALRRRYEHLVEITPLLQAVARGVKRYLPKQAAR